MDYESISKELLEFLDRAHSMFHSIHEIAKLLDEAGYKKLEENKKWDLEKGKGYYVIRNNSSLIAFALPEDIEDLHFQMSAAHSDSPTYKIKSVAEIEGPGDYVKLDVEAYGGMIDWTWMDRMLSIAGRVLVQGKKGIESKLFYVDEDLLVIPDVAIHFNREVNNGYKFNRQVDLMPLFSAGEMKKGSFDQLVADVLGCKVEDILGKDLFLCAREKGHLWGWKKEFISSPRLDDLQCAFVSLKAFLDSKPAKGVNVYCCFDNEEVGSNTKQGAMSTFLKDTLTRLVSCFDSDPQAYYQAVSKSFLVSCDNAHAVHPNHPEKTDQVNCSYLNKGPVIKESANQKYTTDAFSRALFTKLCQMADVPCQVFANRSDVVGGSTLGNLSNTQVSVHAVDIGLPQLAMHSLLETAGSKDTYYTYKALKEYFSRNVVISGADSIEIE